MNGRSQMLRFTSQFWFLFTPREQKALQLFWVAFLVVDYESFEGCCFLIWVNVRIPNLNPSPPNVTAQLWMAQSPPPQLHRSCVEFSAGFIVITLHFQWGGFRPLSNSCTTRDQKAISCRGSSLTFTSHSCWEWEHPRNITLLPWT